jgi:hypothetical protein
VTDTEKLVLVLFGIHEHLGVDSGAEKPVQQAIPTDHTWALIWRPEAFSGQHDKPERSRNVVDTLEILSFIESSYGRLSGEDPARLKTETGFDEPRFRGFDGNTKKTD